MILSLPKVSRSGCHERKGKGERIQAAGNTLMRSPDGEGDWLVGEMDWGPVWLEHSEDEREQRRTGGRRGRREMGITPAPVG